MTSQPKNIRPRSGRSYCVCACVRVVCSSSYYSALWVWPDYSTLIHLATMYKFHLKASMNSRDCPSVSFHLVTSHTGCNHRSIDARKNQKVAPSKSSTTQSARERGWCVWSSGTPHDLTHLMQSQANRSKKEPKSGPLENLNNPANKRVWLLGAVNSQLWPPHGPHSATRFDLQQSF